MYQLRELYQDFRSRRSCSKQQSWMEIDCHVFFFYSCVSIIMLQVIEICLKLILLTVSINYVIFCSDYYFTSAQWVSLTEVCVVWLTRMQNLSVVSVCKSPMWYCQEVRKILKIFNYFVQSDAIRLPLISELNSVAFIQPMNLH